MQQLSSPFKKIDTVILRVRKLEQAREWYKDKLGLGPGYYDEKERLIILKVADETSLTLYELKPGETRPTSVKTGTHPIFYTDDIRLAHRQLKDKGVKADPIEGEPGGTEWFSFTDLDDNLLEACHY